MGVRTMPSPASIFVYGRDPQLLETRRWVLERSGARVWTATELSEFDQVASSEAIDLIILCHSLSMEECGRALEMAHSRWPGVQSLLMMSELSDRYTVSDQIADVWRGPDYLLQTVAKLIGDEHALASHV
jgi:DNA-binding response OmpR family regulator